MHRFRLENVIYTGFGVCLVLNALQAYSILSVPVPWLGNAFLLALTFFFFVRARFISFPGSFPFLLFNIWIFSSCLVILFFRSTIPESPLKATLGYYPYISLRFLNILVCGFAICLSYWLIRKGKKKQLIDFMVNLGLFVGLYSIYVFFAQQHGWPELPRTRIGTGGEAQATSFTYAFHRAMGPFREPSHLAEWLILPLFLSIYQNNRTLNFKAGVLALALLMTGSLTGIVGVLGGAGAAMLVTIRPHLKAVVPPLKIASLVVLAGIVFALFMAGKNANKEVSLTSVLWERIEPILLEDGLKSSNRSYVYYYLDHKPFTFAGDGIGNPNLEFSKFLGSDATASFLSLYISTLYFSGYIGFFILALFLAYPIFIFLRYRRSLRDASTFYLMAAYLGWLITFSIHSEELNFQFGVCYALVVGAIYMELCEKEPAHSL